MKFSVGDFSVGTPACNYRIDAELGFHVEEFRGKVGFHEFRSLRTWLVCDPAWSPDHHALIDLSKAVVDLSTNDVLRLALLMRRDEYRSRGWQAFVVPPGGYGTIRMLGYWMRATDRSRIFAKRSEAEEWLAKNSGSLPPGAVLRPPVFDRTKTELRSAG